MPWTKEELKKLRDTLPKDWKITLADKVGKKPGSVRNILFGVSKNDLVITAALELALAHNAEVEAKKEALKAL